MADFCVTNANNLSPINVNKRLRMIRAIDLWCPYAIEGYVILDYNTFSESPGSATGSVTANGTGSWTFTTPPGVLSFDVTVIGAGGGGCGGSGGRGGDLWDEKEGGKGGNGGNGGRIEDASYLPLLGQTYVGSLGVGGIGGQGGEGTSSDNNSCPGDDGMTHPTSGGTSIFDVESAVGGAGGHYDYGCACGNDLNGSNEAIGGAFGGRGRDAESAGEPGANTSFALGGIGGEESARCGGGSGGGGAGAEAGGNGSASAGQAGNGGVGAGGGGGGGGYGGAESSDAGDGGNGGDGGAGRIYISWKNQETVTTLATWC